MTVRFLRLLAATTALVPAMAAAQTAPTQPTATRGEVPAPIEDAASRAPASPAATAYPPEAVGDGPTTAGYNFSRWAEDWTKFRDPAKREDWIDRLKYIPIGGDDVYLTLSGEARARVNHTTNPNLREGRAQRQDILRLVGGADLHLGDHFRVFGEVAHAGLGGVELGTPTTALRNRLVVQQAFVDATADVADVTLGARYGRQEFTDGANLLISSRDNNTIRFVLNGIRAWARGPRVRVDLFDFKFTALGYGGTRDDRVDDLNRFSGVTTGIVLPANLFGEGQLYVDPFVWRLRSLDQAWGGITAREARNYYGVHVWGDAGRATIDWTINRQGGDFDGRRISAWQVFLAQTYALSDAKTAPRIGVHADYASGGGAYGRGTLRNAFAPFGNNIYYSYQLFATPTNLVAVAPNVQFTPVKGVRAIAEYQFAWRDSQTDAVYRANGSPFAGTELVRGAKFGEMARLQLVWSITPRLSLTGRYEHLAAGPALTRAGYRSSDFLAGWISFRF